MANTSIYDTSQVQLTLAFYSRHGPAAFPQITRAHDSQH